MHQNVPQIISFHLSYLYDDAIGQKGFESMKAGKLAIRPKSSPNLKSCSNKNLPPRDFSLTILVLVLILMLTFPSIFIV